MLRASTSKIYKDWECRIQSFEPLNDQKLIDEASKYEEDFYTFLKEAWVTIEGDRQFIDGWHIEAECEHLEALYYGHIFKLIMNVPPGTCKSTVCSVAFPAWVWAKDPTRQFLYASHGLSLVTRDSVACRRLIASRWFQDRWGYKCRLTRDTNTKTRFSNDQGGYRISTSVNSTSPTGEHVDFEFFDDPNNTANVESEVIRSDTNMKFDRVFSGRFNDPKVGRLALIQQRSNAQDLSGWVLAKNIPGLVHLSLPMEFEVNKKCITIPLKSTNGKTWGDPRTYEGELLWPKFYDEESVRLGKIDLGSEYAIAGQYQQRPSPAEGGIFKKHYCPWWKEKQPPRCHFIIQSWDTAFSTNDKASYSCCINLGVFKDKHDVSNLILLSMWRARVENPDLRRMMIRMSKNYYDIQTDNPVPEDYILRPDMILVEAKANGGPLIQDLNRAGLVINRFDPLKHGGGDKVVRARKISHIIEAGKLWLPADHRSDFTKLRGFADQFIEALASFPNDDNSKDVVDALSQAIIRLRMSAIIDHPDDAYIMENYSNLKQERFY